MVRKSGPVQTARLGSWLIGLFVILLVVIMLALAGGGYLFLQQSKLMADFSEQVNLLMLRAERLEYLVQEQETREVIAQEEAEEQGATKPELDKKPPMVASLETGETSVQPEPTPTTAVAENPRVSEQVSINRIEQRYEDQELLVNYDVTNEQSEGNRAEGYVSLILHSTKDGKARREASPPMRLDANGRPVSYRRGMPFAVHRFRRIAARFDVEGKVPKSLEFIVYSRRGQLLLVYEQPVKAKPEPTPTPAPTTEPTMEASPTATAEPAVTPESTAETQATGATQ